MKTYELNDVINEWDREVELKAAELIRNGVPPYDAISRARDIISTKRRMK